MRHRFPRISCLISPWNTYCRYSLEAPQWGASNEYLQHMFQGEIRKKIFSYHLSYLELWCRHRKKYFYYIHFHIHSSGYISCIMTSDESPIFFVYCSYYWKQEPMWMRKILRVTLHSMWNVTEKQTNSRRQNVLGCYWRKMSVLPLEIVG